jgi:hypothetical protein
VLLPFFEAEILELHPHRGPRVELDRQDAGRGRLALLVVNDLAQERAVDEVPQAVALGNNDIVVPTPGPDLLLELVLDADGLGGLLAVLADRGALAPPGEEGPASLLSNSSR